MSVKLCEKLPDDGNGSAAHDGDELVGNWSTTLPDPSFTCTVWQMFVAFDQPTDCPAAIVTAVPPQLPSVLVVQHE